MIDAEKLIGKTVVWAEIDSFGVELKFNDGSILHYDSSDPWFPCCEIIDDDKQEDSNKDGKNREKN